MHHLLMWSENNRTSSGHLMGRNTDLERLHSVLVSCSLVVYAILYSIAYTVHAPMVSQFYDCDH